MIVSLTGSSTEIQILRLFLFVCLLFSGYTTSCSQHLLYNFGSHHGKLILAEFWCKVKLCLTLLNLWIHAELVWTKLTCSSHVYETHLSDLIMSLTHSSVFDLLDSECESVFRCVWHSGRVWGSRRRSLPPPLLSIWRLKHSLFTSVFSSCGNKELLLLLLCLEFWLVKLVASESNGATRPTFPSTLDLPWANPEQTLSKPWANT